MATVNSLCEFHSELDIVCSSLEAIFQLADSNYEVLDHAACPVLRRFRELLDVGDSLIGSD